MICRCNRTALIFKLRLTVIRLDTSKTLFIFGLVFFAFAYGFISAYAKLPPYALLSDAWNTVVDMAEHWKNDLNIEPTRHLVAADHARSKFSVINPKAAAPGNRLIVGLTAGRQALYGATLYSVDGKELYYWPIDYSLVDPDGPDPENVFPHGFEIFQDGSIIVNFDDGNGIARIGSCGEVIWAVNKWFHHSISKGPDGSVWTLRGLTIVQLDPDTGKQLKQISIKDDIVAAHGFHGVFALHTSEQEEGIHYLDDPYHPNDVEVLKPDTAAAFPMFETGDLLISLRSINLVAVIDGDDYHPKWWMIGPWHRQHDPDFLPNGSISVFNNNMGFGHSQILAIYPQTGKIETLVGGEGGYPFYSWRRGKHEHLDNNNILVTETERGHVFEIDHDQNLVWEYNNIYDEARNGVISKAMVIPENFFLPGALKCRPVN